MEKRAEKIHKFFVDHKRMPTYAELMVILGYKSKSAVHYFVQKLIDQGIILKDKSGKLLPKNLGELRLLGLVEAGFPTSASEELIDTMSLDEFLVGNKEATYLLKVKGDSMQDAGIIAGDLVIVEKGKRPRVGDIVIAEVDREYTMKYYKLSKQGKPFLEPANSKYKPIYPKEELRISAVVTGVIRKYK